MCFTVSRKDISTISQNRNYVKYAQLCDFNVNLILTFVNFCTTAQGCIYLKISFIFTILGINNCPAISDGKSLNTDPGLTDLFSPTLTPQSTHDKITSSLPPSSSGLGRGPLKAKTGIRFPLGAQPHTEPVEVCGFFCRDRFALPGMISNLSAPTFLLSTIIDYNFITPYLI